MPDGHDVLSWLHIGDLHTTRETERNYLGRVGSFPDRCRHGRGESWRFKPLGFGMTLRSHYSSDEPAPGHGHQPDLRQRAVVQVKA